MSGGGFIAVLKETGDLLLHVTERQGIVALDPVTAINNGITAFFNFLSTPAGQKFADAILALDVKFVQKIADLFNHLHSQVQPQTPPAA